MSDFLNAVTPHGYVIAIDGTSGSGKSSTSRGVASKLGLQYLDTGAQFRAITLWMLRNDVDVENVDAVAAHAGEPELLSVTDPTAPSIVLDGVDVSETIRNDEVNAAVSPVSTVPAVRTRLLEVQRAIIREALDNQGIVVEGRDIGSVVWPDALVKIYLSADADARAQRRALEVGSADVDATKASLEARDVIDSSRATAPLVAADGAYHLDTTHLALEQVIDQVVGLVRTARTS